MSVFKDISGKRFGRLKVLHYSHSKNGTFWRCVCDCGNKTIVKASSLNYGSSKSCGCGSMEAAIANLKFSWEKSKLPFRHVRKLKDLYRNIIKRCSDPSDKRWNCYGGRGIKVCKEWRNDRIAFYLWCENSGYKPGLQIDRIDNDGNYEPSNCRFVTQLIQANNTRRNRILIWNGESHTVSEWARILGVRCQALQHRVTRKWKLEKIFNQPFRKKNEFKRLPK